jgi:hypothetical protein
MDAPRSDEQIAYAAYVQALSDDDFERWLRGELAGNPYEGIDYLPPPWDGPVVRREG